MQTKGTSLFAQMLQYFHHAEFAKIVRTHKGDKANKGFTTWEQFVSVLFCHLAKAQTLREICGGLKSCVGKLTHLGMKGTPSKSNLAYANEHRSWEIYRDVFFQLLRTTQSAWKGKRKFRFKNKLYSIDASVIDLCLSIFNWAHFRTTKGAVKLHAILDHDGYLPCYAYITEGAVHEVKALKTTFLRHFRS